MPTEIVLPARAKINLTLEILGKRPDGFHEIMSVMQALDLHDDLRFTLTDGDLHLAVDRVELNTPDNLVWKAATLLRETVGLSYGARIDLIKRTPAAAGLGGGSSDAAATLLGLNELWGRPLGDIELWQLAAGIGSDVPFFLRGGTAIARGRGELISTLPSWPHQSVVLLVPDLNLPDKTRRLYGMLTPTDYSDGAATRAVVADLQSGQKPDPALLVNSFQPVALRSFPPIAYWHDQMLSLGAPYVWLAGAGPTLFTLFDDDRPAQVLAASLRACGAHTICTVTC